MKILCADYGVKTYYRLNKAGLFPSQLLYGAVELENMGFDVDYYQISNRQSLKNVFLDIRELCLLDYDVLFLPYIRSKAIFIILLFKYLGLYKRRIIGVQHKTISAYGLKGLLQRKLYKGVDCMFFHSQKNMLETIANGFTCEEKSQILHWGVQQSFYDKIKKSENTESKVFISTGMENRDFKTLLLGFKDSGKCLNIYATKRFSCSNYLINNMPISSDISIVFVEQKDDTIRELAKKVNDAFCVVVPVLEEYCTYCVGHTSMVEAMALGKPLIVTDNPYHPIDVEKDEIGIKVAPDNPQSLQNAIIWLNNHREKAEIMGCNARKLSESLYNIDVCAKEISDAILKYRK